MNLKRFAARRTLIVCTIAAAVVVGAGAAVAATNGVFDPEQEREAFQAAVAEKLGVTTAELENAYKAAALEQLDAAVAAGRLTEEQAAAIRERIEAGAFLGPHFGFGFKHHLEGRPGLEGSPGLGRRSRLPRPDRGGAPPAAAQRPVARRDRRGRGQERRRPGAGAARRREGAARPGGRGRPAHRCPAGRAGRAAGVDDRRHRQRHGPAGAPTLRTQVRRAAGRIIRTARTAERVAPPSPRA